MKALHPVALQAVSAVRSGLAVLEQELSFARTVDEALALHDQIAALYTEVDRLELVALARAEALIGVADVHR